MVGWIITNKKIGIQFTNHFKYNDWYFGYTSNGRFEDDKLFFETKNSIICLDGVILNKKTLSNGNEWKNFVMDNIDNDDCIPNVLRGSFNGFIFYKDSGQIKVFVDHLGERPIFYNDDKENIIISSNYNIINDCLIENDMKRILDLKAVKYMLSFGYMIEDCTYIQKVKRVMPGVILRLKKVEGENYYSIEKKQYHCFTSKIVSADSDEKIIAKLDKLFRNAVKMQMEKDKEYDKISIIDLSGGLDCRLINYVAKSMGYDNFVNISFSQLGSNESKVTMLLSKHLNSDLIYYPLNNARYISKAEEIVGLNYGLSLYSTTTGILNMLKTLNYQFLGIEHGGLLGDMYDGVMCGEKYTQHEPASFGKGMKFSDIVPNSALDEEVLKQYENNEIFTVYGRGLLAGYSTVIMRQHYNEFLSPYGDVDFYDYFLTIPVKKRVVEKITHRWIEKCYPEALEVVYDKTMSKLNENKLKINTKMFFRKVNFKLMTILKITQKNNMNPMEYWYKTNASFRGFIESYYKENKEFVINYPEIKTYMDEMYKIGKVRDKTMVITALAAIKKYTI